MHSSSPVPAQPIQLQAAFCLGAGKAKLPSEKFQHSLEGTLQIFSLHRTAAPAPPLPFGAGYEILLLSLPEGSSLLQGTEVGSCPKHPVLGLKGIFFLLFQKAGETSPCRLQEGGWKTRSYLYFLSYWPWIKTNITASTVFYICFSNQSMGSNQPPNIAQSKPGARSPGKVLQAHK